MQTCSVQVCSMQVCALRSLQSLHNAASVQCSVCKCALLSVPCGSVQVCITCGSVQVCITCGSVQVCIKVFSGQFYCYRESLCHSRDPPPTAPPALLLKILYSETLFNTLSQMCNTQIQKHSYTQIQKHTYTQMQIQKSKYNSPPTAPPALLLKILYGETHWKIFCFDIVKYSNGVHKNIRNMKSLSCLALLPFV